MPAVDVHARVCSVYVDGVVVVVRHQQIEATSMRVYAPASSIDMVRIGRWKIRARSVVGVLV